MGAVAVSPDGHWSVTGSMDKTARLWNLETGSCLHTFAGLVRYPHGFVRAVAVSRDGRRVVTGSSDGVVSILDVETARRLHTFAGTQADICSITVVPDDRRVVIVSLDGFAELRDLETGLCLQTYKSAVPSYEADIMCEGRLLLTGHLDHTVKFWDLETGALLATMHNVDEGFLWTTPPSPNAPSGWLWTDRQDLVSVVRCEKDGSNPEPLSDGDPVRKAYLMAHNRQDMVMSRLWLSGAEINDIENGLAARIEAVASGKPVFLPPPQLGLGKPSGHAGDTR